MKCAKMAAVVLSFVVFVSGCQFLSEVLGIGGAGVSDYFPLTEGASWTLEGQIDFYDSTGTTVDNTASVDATVRLYVSGEKEIGGVTCAVLKASDFESSTLEPEETDEVNTVIESCELYVTHTDQGLSVFGGLFYYGYDYEYNDGSGYSSETILDGTITGGIPIIPVRVLTSESVDASGSYSYSWEDTDAAGNITHQNSRTLTITSETVVETDETTVTTDAGEFECAVVSNSTVATTEDTYYDSSMTDPTVETTVATFDTSFSVSKGIGLVRAEMEADFGSDTANAYMMKSVALELVAATGL